jgi:hypothetical protein
MIHAQRRNEFNLYNSTLIPFFMLRSRPCLSLALRRLSSRLIPIMNTSSHLLTANTVFQEEENPDYDPSRFYPARAGKPSKNIKSSRSWAGELAQQFGWPRASTGLCNALCSQLVMTNCSWPWQSNRYVALKIINCFERDQKSANDELEMSQHISKIQSKHEVHSYARLIQDSFRIPGPFGEHLVMVFELLREPPIPPQSFSEPFSRTCLKKLCDPFPSP